MYIFEKNKVWERMSVRPVIRAAAGLLAVLLGLSRGPALWVSAAEPAEAVAVQAPSCVLTDDRGTVLYEKNADQKMPPASVTKIMTMLLVMEAIESGELAFEDVVTASARAAGMGGSQIWLKEGEQLTVEEMFKCVAVVSANDCCVALAEHIAGSETAFVARMNARAQELGMFNTAFVNCCGLEAEGHYTTARDIARMSAELIRHEKIFDYTTIWMDTIRDGAFGLTNTNKMIRTYDGMLGLKTGYTSQAGYCLSGVAQRDGLRLIAVVLRGESSASRNSDVAALLNYGFAGYASVEFSPDQPLMPVPVVMGRQDCVPVRLADSRSVLVEKRLLQGLEKQIELVGSVEAPVRAGDVLGSFTVCGAGGGLLWQTDILADGDVEALSLLDLWGKLLEAATLRSAA